MERCLSGGILLQNHLREKKQQPPEGRDVGDIAVSWVLLGAHQRPGAGEAACAAGARW